MLVKAWFASDSGGNIPGRIAVVLSRASGLSQYPIDDEGHISLRDIVSLSSTGRPIHCLEKDRHLLDLSSNLPGRGVQIIVASEAAVPADLLRDLEWYTKELITSANAMLCNICGNNSAPIAPDGRLCVCKGIQKIPGFKAAFAVALTYFTSAFCHKKKQ